jgi:hypothetical protein
MSLLMASLIPHFVGDGRQTIENNQRRQHLIIKIGISKRISIGCYFKVNNRYQEMSGIMINESFNGLVNSPLRGGWKTNNREQSKKTTSYN